MACTLDDCRLWNTCNYRIATAGLDMVIDECSDYRAGSPETTIGYKTELLAKLVAEGEFPAPDLTCDELEHKLSEVAFRKANMTGCYWVCECGDVRHIDDKICIKCRGMLEDGTGRYATVQEAALYLLPKVIELNQQAKALLDEAMVYMNEISEL